MKRVAMILAAAALLPAGCRPTAEKKGSAVKEATKDTPVFDVETGFSFKNHFKKSGDPAGDSALVFQTADKHKKMTFVQKDGFFTVPAGHRGTLVLSVLLQKARRLKVAVVGEKSHKSYYLEVRQEGLWTEVSLPLSDLKGKVAEGEKVNDVTVWLKPDKKGEKLPAEAQLFLRKAVLRF